MVALSTLILAPMDQTGWRTACSGVTPAICAGDQSRKGPPEAVRMIFSTAANPSPPRLISAWKIALCSESTGSSVAPLARAASSTISPAQTRLSLLAMASVPPRASAASVLRSPTAPTMAAMVQSAGRAAASITASGPAAVATPVPASASARAGPRAASATTARRAPCARAWAASVATSRPATSASTAKLPGSAASSSASVLRPIEPVLPRMVMLRARAVPKPTSTTSRSRGAPRRRAPR